MRFHHSLAGREKFRLISALTPFSADGRKYAPFIYRLSVPKGSSTLPFIRIISGARLNPDYMQSDCFVKRIGQQTLTLYFFHGRAISEVS